MILFSDLINDAQMALEEMAVGVAVGVATVEEVALAVATVEEVGLHGGPAKGNYNGKETKKTPATNTVKDAKATKDKTKKK